MKVRKIKRNIEFQDLPRLKIIIEEKFLFNQVGIEIPLNIHIRFVISINTKEGYDKILNHDDNRSDKNKS